jgi:hypothetical protein
VESEPRPATPDAPRAAPEGRGRGPRRSDRPARRDAPEAAPRERPVPERRAPETPPAERPAPRARTPRTRSDFGSGL